MNVLLVTDDSVRHQWFVTSLARLWPDLRWMPCHRDRASYYKPPDHRLMRRHFRRFAATERRWFAPHVDHRLLSERTVPGTLDDLTFATQVDVVVLYSTPIITGPLLDHPNLWGVHAGLLPWYRGSTTNLMPIIHGRPEYVGMTLHKLAAGVDAGRVILHARPELNRNDSSHTAGCKGTIVAAGMVNRALRRLQQDGTVPTVDQTALGTPATFKKSDFTVEALRTMNREIRRGALGRANRQVRMVSW